MNIFVKPFNGTYKNEWIELDQYLLDQEKNGNKTGSWKDFASYFRIMLEQARIEVRATVKIS